MFVSGFRFSPKYIYYHLYAEGTANLNCFSSVELIYIAKSGEGNKPLKGQKNGHEQTCQTSGNLPVVASDEKVFNFCFMYKFYPLNRLKAQAFESSDLHPSDRHDLFRRNIRQA